jgi:SAM-dependent methyltransferase
MSKASTKSSKRLHWDATSQDYLRFRPGYPREFFTLLRHLGIGRPGQRILDLGAGTGALAIPFAQAGASVTAVDLSSGQIRAAQQSARRRNVKIVFLTAPAERTRLPNHSFDVISASMCWRYFDEGHMVKEVLRLLRPGGCLLICSLLWIPDIDEIGSKTDTLMRAYNPQVHWRDRTGDVEVIPQWSVERFRLRSCHQFTTDIFFSRASWRGRIRASKWIGAGLPAEKAKAFDEEHKALLERVAPTRFAIPHRIRLQVFEPK